MRGVGMRRMGSGIHACCGDKSGVPDRGRRRNRVRRRAGHGRGDLDGGSVAADPASDVWVTGVYEDPATSSLQPFTAHWNGTTWTSVPVPADGTEYFGLTVIGSADAWAVGSNNNGPVTANWNGTSWREVPNPGHGVLLSVTATGPANVTAVGRDASQAGTNAAILLTWNGSPWASDTVPSVGGTEELFSASAALGGSVTWAIGASYSATGAAASLLLRNG